jgi:hypothetical protein
MGRKPAIEQNDDMEQIPPKHFICEIIDMEGLNILPRCRIPCRNKNNLCGITDCKKFACDDHSVKLCMRLG